MFLAIGLTFGLAAFVAAPGLRPRTAILDNRTREWPVSALNTEADTLAKKKLDTRPPDKKTKAARHQPADRGLPSRAQILEFLSTAAAKAGKREIARAFGITGGAKIALKRILSEMAADGTLSGTRKDLREKGTLPPVTTLEITGRDRDGDLLAKPLHWEEDDGKRPIVRLNPT